VVGGQACAFNAGIALKRSKAKAGASGKLESAISVILLALFFLCTVGQTVL